MIDPRIQPLLYNLREYSNLKVQQLSGKPFPNDGLFNGEWMTFGMYIKGAQYRKLGVFARDALVSHILSQYAGGGLQKNIISANLQISLLGGVERALFHRMSTPARSLAHAVARNFGMGSEDVSIFDQVKDKLQKLEN